MVRIATAEDLNIIVELSISFIKETIYKDIYTEEAIRAVAEDLVLGRKSEKIVFLYEDKGMLAGAVTPFIFGNDKVATELAWYVKPEHRRSNIGKELINAFEIWAKATGCARITMIGLEEGTTKLYEKLGYIVAERTHLKEIN